MEQSVSCPRASRDAPLIPAGQQRQHGAGGGCRPLELFPSNCSRLGVSEKNPDTGNKAEVWGDSVHQGLDSRREKPCTFWRPESLLCEPGETFC